MALGEMNREAQGFSRNFPENPAGESAKCREMPAKNGGSHMATYMIRREAKIDFGEMTSCLIARPEIVENSGNDSDTQEV
jgi:hypothetical protein